MEFSLMIDPPQNGVQPSPEVNPTCQGYSFSSVTTPATIFETLLAFPQSQEPEVGVVLFPVGAVVGAMVGFIVVGGGAVGGFINISKM
jgi:hypothetical protein